MTLLHGWFGGKDVCSATKPGIHCAADECRAFFCGVRSFGHFAAKIRGCPFVFYLSELIVTTLSPAKPLDLAQLDRVTGGAFTAPTAGERAARVREWLATEPAVELLAEVFKELSVKDKGAAKLVRERLDEFKRAKGQEAIAQEWALKAQALLAMPKLNIADALAWQRDAAKAGAPLSKEPLSGLKTALAERVRSIEDLQHQVQVQREAAVLLAQRIEVLSTKSWQDAQAAADTLQTDVAHWQTQATALADHVAWASVDMKFPPLLEASRAQLLVVWEAFQGAVAMAATAAQDATAALPPVPVWADEIRVARGVPVDAEPKPAKATVDPALKAQAQTAVRGALTALEAEVAQGHGKASAGAAAALRNALKEFSRLIDSKLENQAHAALAAAGELEGWQRWRADQLREELVAKAEGLLQRPEGQAIGGRKMQETLRTLREQWKQTDQGGVPNHTLWKRFDEACNAAYHVVEAWLEKVKAESAAHKAQRLALIEELKAWAEANRTALDDDWKGFSRILHQFADRWRDAGHVGEKMFAELQPVWKAAMAHAAAPLEALQAQSIAARHAMIEEAKVLGAAPVLRIDAVKALQQRWQAQAHAVPIERRLEQKLWDAFRKPIDDAFHRKTAEREKAEQALGARDRAVMDAAKALEAANASGDAQAIRAAMAGLEAALAGQAQAQAQVQAAEGHETAAQGLAQAANAQEDSQQNSTQAPVESAQAAIETIANDAVSGPTENTPAAPAPAPVVAKPVIAVRGDDRPGARREAPVPAPRAGKWADRKDGPRTGDRDARRDPRSGPGMRRDEPAAPRLGDAAFRAQRDAMEHAQAALRKLAAQAHGEALTHLLAAWEQRDATRVPSVQELGGRMPAATRSAWVQAISTGKVPDAKAPSATEALLRLEMAAEVPTPAEQLAARRALQLQLLTRRNDPAPVQTWGADAAIVLAGAFATDDARRLQNTLKVLLRR